MAAEQGEPVAQYCIGIMYENGDGVEKDYKKAKEWYEKSAKQGNVEALVSLAIMYEEGKGVEPDFKKAISWYKKAAKAGYAGALDEINRIKKIQSK